MRRAALGLPVVVRPVLLVRSGFLVIALAMAAAPAPAAGDQERDHEAEHGLERDRTDDEEVRRLAGDIAHTQQAQIGEMRGWLDAWGRPPTTVRPPMEWMGHGLAAGERMPGLASDAEVAQLTAAHGKAAEVLFLELMIRHHQGGRHMAELAEATATRPFVRSLARGETVEYRGQQLKFAWVDDGALDVWVAAYGPKALAATGEVGDGYILQLADPSIAEWMITAVRRSAEQAGRDPAAIKFCVAAPAYVGDDLEHQREQTRWFGGMVGNHVADIVGRYGTTGAVPRALTDYIEGRKGYDYAEHGRAGNTHTDFVPDEVVDRFCILGPVDEHVRRLSELASLGVDQFAVYLQHDGKDSTLAAYGEQVIPAVTELLPARSCPASGPSRR